MNYAPWVVLHVPHDAVAVPEDVRAQFCAQEGFLRFAEAGICEPKCDEPHGAGLRRLPRSIPRALRARHCSRTTLSILARRLQSSEILGTWDSH